MILRDVQMTGRCLPERTHAKNQAVAFPSFLVDLKNRNARGRAGQAGPETACSLLPVKTMGIETMRGADILDAPRS